MDLTRKETIELIKIKEKEKDFNTHLNPIDWDNSYPVDANYIYIHKDFKTKFKYKLFNIFEINPFMKKLNKDFKTKIYGLENLKGLDKGIITCNHTNKFDCLVIKSALKKDKKNVYFTAAPFNNQKGHFGDLMRAGGLLPFSTCLNGMKNFNNAIKELLDANNFIVFYPEQAMWLYYRKTRPYLDGAFHYAYKNNVPIIPMFMTFSDDTSLDEEGLAKQNFHLHILKPIYPDLSLPPKESIKIMNDTNQEMIKDVYKSFYKTKIKKDDN